MLLKIYPENPNPRAIRQVVECLQDGGVIIYPTDTIYGIGCDIFKAKSAENIIHLQKLNKKKSTLSIICHDLSHLSDFTRPIPNPVFKAMKRSLPGPFTFILEANNRVPKLLQSNRKTVGIRVPDNTICREIVRVLDHPILSTSVKDDDTKEYISEPELIHEKYGHWVDIVIDGGYGDTMHSTIVDCTSGVCDVIRNGKGDTNLLY
ncbi:MAG: threonylcarbamoyl-AMP synthase [Bacteroidales bacterium]|jgi:tRNA threonylcarbamoyl adenosine modification protein (Sua5/YciO/YrdC/YwlC family)|nr:threonylcarbamoyl-AMP synthase [Bacteroidales bacterium]